MSLCILCEKHPPIENSHIISKFVFRGMKKATPVTTLRYSRTPKVPIQDGPTRPYLCKDCEQKFSGSENYFWQTILEPYLSGLDGGKSPGLMSYDSRLSLFVASIHFRYLRYMADENPGKHSQFPQLLYDRLKAACDSQDPAPPGVFQYLWFLHPVISTCEALPPGINAYWFFATDGTTFPWIFPDGQSMAVSYVKLPGIALIASERELPVRPGSEHLVVPHRILEKGQLNPADSEAIVVDVLKENIFRAIHIMNEQQSQMPQKAMKKIEEQISADPDHADTLRHKVFELDSELLRQSQGD